MTGDRVKRRLQIEVACALPDRQMLIALEIEEGTTVLQAIERSGILARFPNVELGRGRVGVFGAIVPLETLLRDGDRVEIYRPLVSDPKDARRERATPRKTSPRR